MFEQALAIEYHTGHRAWSTMAGMAGQAALVTAAVLGSLVAPESLPQTQTLVQLFLPHAPAAPAAPAPPPTAPSARVVRPALNLRDGVLRAPAAVPAQVTLIEEPPLPAVESGVTGGGVPGGIPGGMRDGIPGGLADMVARQVAPPAPSAAQAAARPAEKPAEPQRITVGGLVQQARLLKQVLPVYPQLAVQARIHGTVQLVGIIGQDGRIKQLQAIAGHPLLVPAAIEAVRQWIYRPTYLNGEPVEVVAPITVSFVLN